MQHATKLTVIALSSVVLLSSINTSWAFKRSLRGAVRGAARVEQPAPEQQPQTQSVDQTTQQPQQATAPSGPIQYTNQKYGYSVDVPGSWQQMTGTEKSKTALFSHLTGHKGSFQVNTNWMADDFPVGASLKAMEKQYGERLKHGELDKYYRKDYTMKDANGKDIVLFQGYVTIESAEDPDIQRMQWIGYGKGNYYNFTWSSSPDQFESYMPEFESILNNVQFTQ